MMVFEKCEVMEHVTQDMLVKAANLRQLLEEMSRFLNRKVEVLSREVVGWAANDWSRETGEYDPVYRLTLGSPEYMLESGNTAVAVILQRRTYVGEPIGRLVDDMKVSS